MQEVKLKRIRSFALWALILGTQKIKNCMDYIFGFLQLRRNDFNIDSREKSPMKTLSNHFQVKLHSIDNKNKTRISSSAARFQVNAI